MTTTLRTTGLALGCLAVGVLGLSACSSSPAAVPANPAVPATTSTSSTAPTSTLFTGETRKPESPTSTRTEPSRTTSATTSSGSGQAGSGFDGKAFQQAMAAVSVPATSSTAGSINKGAGTMSYTMTGSQAGIGRIDCMVVAQGGSDTQSDQDALGLATPFLPTCGAFDSFDDNKTKATQYVRTNLPTLQGEAMVTTTLGPIELKVGRAGPGHYFVTIVNGG